MKHFVFIHLRLLRLFIEKTNNIIILIVGNAAVVSRQLKENVSNILGLPLTLPTLQR